MRPHRWQPTRLPGPWDSPGKNTGVGCHFLLQCMKVKSESEVAQLCPTVSDPMDCSLPGSSIHGIFQGRVLGWGAIAFCISYVWLFASSWTVAHQAPLSMGFSRQEYWSGLPCPPPGDLPKPCLLCILHRQAGSLPRKLRTCPLGEPIWAARAHSLTDPSVICKRPYPVWV